MINAEERHCTFQGRVPVIATIFVYLISPLCEKYTSESYYLRAYDTRAAYGRSYAITLSYDGHARVSYLPIIGRIRTIYFKALLAVACLIFHLVSTHRWRYLTRQLSARYHAAAATLVPLRFSPAVVPTPLPAARSRVPALFTSIALTFVAGISFVALLALENLLIFIWSFSDAEHIIYISGYLLLSEIELALIENYQHHAFSGKATPSPNGCIFRYYGLFTLISPPHMPIGLPRNMLPRYRDELLPPADDAGQYFHYAIIIAR